MGGLLECMMKMQIIFYLKNNIVKTVYSPNEYDSSFGIFLHIHKGLSNLEKDLVNMQTKTKNMNNRPIIFKMIGRLSVS